MLSSVLIAGLVAVSSVSARALPPRATTFGTCGSPAIIFANGLDGRKEPAFEPANKVDFNHGSALGIGVITSFICQQLNDKCKASADVISECNAGATAAAKLTGQAAADAFNAALGVTATSSSPVTSAPEDSNPPAASPTTPAEAVQTSPAPATDVTNNGPLSFGKCKDPSVIFGAGLDGRKATEFSFLPNNLQEFAHGSALNPDIIYQSNCDTLVNKCGLTQTDPAVIACRDAQKVADGLGKTGASADKFNELLGFNTNFAALDSSNPASPAAPAATPTSAPVLAADPTSVCTPETTTVVTTVTAAAPATTPTTGAAPADEPATPAGTPATNTGKLDLGTCDDITVQFGFGLDGRKATEGSFIPNNQAQFPHNSALNPDIIYQSQCDTLVNRCGLKQTDEAVVTCRNAQKVADAVGRTGASADKFNELMGFTTNFAAVTAPAAKRSASQKLRRDPRLALKEMTGQARKRGFTPSRPVKMANSA